MGRIQPVPRVLVKAESKEVQDPEVMVRVVCSDPATEQQRKGTEAMPT